METTQVNIIQPHLQELKEKLLETTRLAGGSLALGNLINEVESALERINNGTYGICEQCHEPIEDEYIKADPLVRICFSHLSEPQKRAIEKDLELAYKIQNNLLPEIQNQSSLWDIHCHYQPAGPLSGDFYDLITSDKDSNEVFFLFGDVSGKGISAALLMSNLNAIFRTLSAANLPLKELVETANRLFSGSTLPAHFATLVCGRTSASGKIELCIAGHCRPLVIRGPDVLAIDSTGLPLGVHYSGEYDVKTHTLKAGEILFLYTDGLTETRNSSGMEYGETKLSDFLSMQSRLSPDEMVKQLLDDVKGFRAGAPVTDDLTIMIIRRK